jgi:hypothetical protein
MFLTALPDPTAGALRLGGWFTGAAPSLIAGISAGAFRFDASYVGDYRYSAQTGHIYLQEGELGVSFPELGPLRLSLSALGGRFDAGAFPEDAFIYAGAESSARLAFTDSLTLLADYRLEVRSSGAERDLVHLADVRLAYRPRPRLAVAPVVSYLRADGLGSSASGTFERLRGGMDGSAVWRRLSVLAGAWAGPLSTAGRRDLYVGGRLEVRVQLLAHLDAFAAGDWSQPVSTGAPDDYARRFFALGLITHATSAAPLTPAPPARRDQRPVVQGRTVRFRLRAAGATKVVVVGSWDDWDPAGRALAPTGEDDGWEVSVELPPGSHRYRFMVDGQARRPPDAARYVADGFGGEDGVVDIPGAEGAR